MTGSATLYNRDVLAVAASLARWPLFDRLAIRGAARSSLCGSTLELGLEIDAHGRISNIGMLVRACAIGQASAALFAAAAPGLDRQQIGAALADLDAWLKEGGGEPHWPGIGLLDAARAYPARHGAILLPWQAARDALSSAENRG